VEDSETYLLADFLNGTSTTFLAVDHTDPDLPKVSNASLIFLAGGALVAVLVALIAFLA